MQLATSALQSIVLSLGLAAITCHAQSAGAGTAPMQSQASFETAIETHSTSPFYVLISAVDDNTGQSRTYCTTANFLMGAIHREYGIGYGRDDIAKADAIAIASKDHVFHFRKQEALDNIRPDYSEEELAAARESAAPQYSGYNKNAVACVLIERGLSPRMGDRSGQVYISQIDNRKPQ
jgi:hypothetical protein